MVFGVCAHVLGPVAGDKPQQPVSVWSEDEGAEPDLQVIAAPATPFASPPAAEKKESPSGDQKILRLR